MANTFPYFSKVLSPATRKINSSDIGPTIALYKNIVQVVESAEAASTEDINERPKMFKKDSNT